MNVYQKTYKDIKHRYEHGDISYEQAMPVLQALDAAYALESDYNGLCDLYRQAQELRYLMRDITQVRPSKHTEAVQRADRQWHVVRTILEQFALDEQHPGRGGKPRPQIDADDPDYIEREVFK